MPDPTGDHDADDASRPDGSLGRDRRVRRASDFEAAYTEGRKAVERCLVLWRRDVPGSPATRLGVVASRKMGGAVERNRAKRRLREAFRRHRDWFKGASEVILVARPRTLSADWAEVVADLRHAAERVRPGSDPIATAKKQ